MTTNPVPVEPCCIWRMIRNGWTYDQITRELHITGPAVMKAEQTQNLALRDVDPKLIADPMIQRKPKKDSADG